MGRIWGEGVSVGSRVIVEVITGGSGQDWGVGAKLVGLRLQSWWGGERGRAAKQLDRTQGRLSPRGLHARPQELSVARG